MSRSFLDVGEVLGGVGGLPFVDVAQVREGLVLFLLSEVRAARSVCVGLEGELSVVRGELARVQGELVEAREGRARLDVELGQVRAEYGARGECVRLLVGEALVHISADPLSSSRLVLPVGCWAETLLMSAIRGGDVEAMVVWVKRCGRRVVLVGVLEELLARAPERWPLVALFGDVLGGASEVLVSLSELSGLSRRRLMFKGGVTGLRALALRVEGAACLEDLPYIRFMLARRFEGVGEFAEAQGRYRELVGVSGFAEECLVGLARLYCLGKARLSVFQVSEMFRVWLEGSVVMGRGLMLVVGRSASKMGVVMGLIAQAVREGRFLPLVSSDLPSEVAGGWDEDVLCVLNGLVLSQRSVLLRLSWVGFVVCVRAQGLDEVGLEARAQCLRGLVELVEAEGVGGRSRRLQRRVVGLLRELMGVWCVS